MAAIHLDDLSPFGRLALKLDREFSELSRAGEQLARLDLESDGGLDDGIRLLQRAADHGRVIAEAMQEFSAALQQARDQADGAMKVVAERAQVIKVRREQQEILEQQLAQVKEALKGAGAALTEFSKPRETALSDEDRAQISAELRRLEEPMAKFIEAAQAIKGEAARLKFRRLERQADAIIDSLQASRRKLAQAIGPK